MSGLATATAELAEKAIFTPGTPYYLSITHAFGATEASGGSYARKAIQFGTPTVSTGVAQQASTDQQTITTPTSVSTWPYVAVWTALSGGSRKWSGTRTDSTKTVAVGAGQKLQFPAGAVVAKVS